MPRDEWQDGVSKCHVVTINLGSSVQGFILDYAVIYLGFRLFAAGRAYVVPRVAEGLALILINLHSMKKKFENHGYGQAQPNGLEDL
ncbi:hypothetical protein EVAR_97221_1 [Eumeta japonica]|uniref:Uncharacterized protein n=1 Tax=Eumeta variegata TaxID=151549 RepID=A0A4C1WIP7_EUMVA|nr:hypothetical protein EVAR_97221_1 [Eumeta japonica]